MRTILDKLVTVLDNRRTFQWLLGMNILVVFATLLISRNTFLSDGWSYLGLAEGILHGEYSMWWTLDEPYPDTFRAPGYPLLIAFFTWLTGSWKSMFVVHFILYWVGLWFVLRILKEITPQRAVQSLFLLLLLPLINIPFYIGQLYTEIPVLAAMSVVLYLLLRKPRARWWDAPVLGITLGLIHLCKPIYVLLPIAILFGSLVFDRRASNLRKQAVMLAAFGVTVLPYGLWSLKHHGRFMITPIEGGGGYMHFAYWCGKMPNYTDHFSLGNFTGDELIRFTPEDSVQSNIAAFEKEWKEILAQLDPMLTRKDSIMLRSGDRIPYIAEPTYNTSYALERERILKQRAFSLMLSDPWYTFSYKCYSAVRLWVIGIQKSEFRAASFGQKARMAYATLSTGIIFLLSIVLVPLAYIRKTLTLRSTWPFLLLLVYTGLLHIPFTIQSRYTVCVRFAMLALLSMACISLLGKRNDQPTEGGDRASVD